MGPCQAISRGQGSSSSETVADIEPQSPQGFSALENSASLASEVKDEKMETGEADDDDEDDDDKGGDGGDAGDLGASGSARKHKELTDGWPHGRTIELRLRSVLDGIEKYANAQKREAARRHKIETKQAAKAERLNLLHTYWSKREKQSMQRVRIRERVTICCNYTSMKDRRHS